MRRGGYDVTMLVRRSVHARPLRAIMLAPLLGALTILSACADPVPALPTGPARPPMWVVHDADTRIVILGGVHQLPANLEWTGGRLSTELGLARELLLELSPDESARARVLFSTMANDEQVDTLAARHGAIGDSIVELAQASGLAPADANHTEDWALALLTGNVMARGSGLTAENGVETVLTAAFRAHELPIGGLETAQVQLDMFDNLSPADQATMLRTTLASGDESTARTRRLLAAWAAGDVRALADIAEETVAATPFLIEPMLTARNRAWAAVLTARLERRGDVLVAVGVGHLVGDGSLLDELRARGLRPMRLQ